MKLNKKEFIATIANKVEGTVTNKLVAQVLESFQSTLLEVLKTEKEVQLLDIGKLKISHRSQRNGINPKTKELITLPAKDVPKLAPSKKLKSYVSGSDGVTIKSFTY